jgi:hypothetical protein
MRKLNIILVGLGLILLFSGEPVLSSEVELGIRAGMLRSKAQISRDLPGIAIGSMDTISFGAYLSYFFIGDQLGLQPEIHYSVNGFDALETDMGQEISSKYKVSYIKLPLLISYRLPLKGRLKPGVVFGPYFGFADKVIEVQTAFGQTEERDVGDNLKQLDIGLVFGGNVRYCLGMVSLLLSARYNLGLSNISRDITDVAYDFYESDSIKNRAFSVSFGVAVNLR